MVYVQAPYPGLSVEHEQSMHKALGSFSSIAERGRGSQLARRSLFQRNRVTSTDECALS